MNKVPKGGGRFVTSDLTLDGVLKQFRSYDLERVLGELGLRMAGTKSSRVDLLNDFVKGDSDIRRISLEKYDVRLLKTEPERLAAVLWSLDYDAISHIIPSHGFRGEFFSFIYWLHVMITNSLGDPLLFHEPDELPVEILEEPSGRLVINEQIARELTEHIFKDTRKERYMPTPIGILLGKGGVITEAIQVDNNPINAYRYLTNSAESFELIKDLSSKGVRVLGIYHAGLTGSTDSIGIYDYYTRPQTPKFNVWLKSSIYHVFFGWVGGNSKRLIACQMKTLRIGGLYPCIDVTTPVDFSDLANTLEQQLWDGIAEKAQSVVSAFQASEGFGSSSDKSPFEKRKPPVTFEVKNDKWDNIYGRVLVFLAVGLGITIFVGAATGADWIGLAVIALILMPFPVAFVFVVAEEAEKKSGARGKVKVVLRSCAIILGAIFASFIFTAIFKAIFSVFGIEWGYWRY